MVYNRLIAVAVTMLFLIQFSLAQKIEININAYAGLFHYQGAGATSKSSIFLNQVSERGNFTENPYGKKTRFSYVFELQMQHATAGRNIFGVGLGSETVKSKVIIDSLVISDLFYSAQPANGSTTLQNSLVTLNPYLGHRYIFNKVHLDLLAGVDVAFRTQSEEKASVTSENQSFIVTRYYKAKPPIDYSLRVQVKMQLQRFGILAGYSQGLTKYSSTNHSHAHSGFLRAGIGYQIR